MKEFYWSVDVWGIRLGRGWILGAETVTATTKKRAEQAVRDTFRSLANRHIRVRKGDAVKRPLFTMSMLFPSRGSR